MQLNMTQMWRLVFIHFFIAMCFNLVSHAQSLKQKDDIQIQYHTVNIDTKSVTHPFTSLYINDVVKYHGLYFCLFREKPLDEHFSNQFSHILVIHPEDFSFSEVDIPDSVVFSNYSQMFVRNDSILIKGYYRDEKDYYITNSISSEKEKACWVLKETSPVSSVVFKDEDYKIVFTDMGEWGHYMSFIDLSDDVEHLYRIGGGRIFRQPDGFYFCNNKWIGEIANPKDGVIHERGSGYYDAYASLPDTLFRFEGFDKYFTSHDEDTLLNAYFMHDNVIHMIETDQKGSYLSKFAEGKIVRLNNLNQRYEHIGCSNLGAISGGNGGLFYCLPSLNCHDTFGLIDIDSNLIKIINVVTNQAPSITFSGKDGLKETLAFVIDGFSSKTIGDADTLESKLGSYRNTINSYLKYESQYESESRTFYRFVDSDIFVSAEYGYDANTGLLNCLFLEWRPCSELSVSRYNNGEEKSCSESQIRQEMIATINEILQCKPKKKKGGYVWATNDVIIALWSSGARLLILKDDMRMK